MSIHLWHGLQAGPVLDTFNQIVQAWNQEHADLKVETKAYAVFDQPAKDALKAADGEQPQLVLAPEYTQGSSKVGRRCLNRPKFIPHPASQYLA